jgi:hypothetical protein
MLLRIFAKSNPYDYRMKRSICAALVLAALPPLAGAEGAPGDARSVEQRQQDLEKRVAEQDARIAELERMLREALGAKAAPGAAPAVPAAESPVSTASSGAGPTQTEGKLSAEAGKELSVTNPTYEFIGPAEVQGPEYVGNQGFKLYESRGGQIYMRLFSYARYLNQKGLDPSYTDSFGTVKTVPLRQDFQLQKFFLPFSGWFLDPRFRFYLYVWSANTAQGDPAQVVGAGNLSWALNKRTTLGMGITSLPGVRSTEGQFPYWLGVDDRMTADEFFRPSYSTGIWLRGTLVPGLNYQAMLATNMSILGVSASQLDNKIDTYTLMLNWMPTTKEFGPLGSFGDYESHQEVATRIGVHYTHSTENSQEQPGTETIENTQIRLTDGNTIFTPNLFGPGIQVEDVRYQMASLDAGVKYRGYSLEAEYYWRHLSDFSGPGVTPGLIDEIDDTGYQIQASAMLVPRLVQVYGGYSEIQGPYGDSNELRAGFNYFPNRHRGIRVNGEYLRLDDIPVGYTAVPYPVGGNGDVFHLNFEMNF